MRVSVGFTRDFKRLWCGREDLARVELGRLRTKRAWFLTTVNLGSPPVVMSYRSPRCPRHGGALGSSPVSPHFKLRDLGLHLTSTSLPAESIAPRNCSMTPPSMSTSAKTGFHKVGNGRARTQFDYRARPSRMRNARAKGKRIGRPTQTYLDQDARRSIWEAHKRGGVSLRQLAKQFSTSLGTVQRSGRM